MNQGKRIVLNAIWNLAALTVQVAIQIVLTPILRIHLGLGGYGVWASTGNLFSYTRLLSAGMNSGVNNWIPKLLVQKDSEGVSRVVNTTLLFYLIMMCVGGVLYGFAIWKFPEWGNVPEDLRATSRWVVAIVGAALLVFVPLNVFGAVLTGMQRYDFYSGTELAGNTFRLVGTLGLVAANLGIVALAVVHAVGQLIKSISQVCLALVKGPKLFFGIQYAKWTVFREMFAYSMNTLLYAMGVMIQTQGAVTLTTFLISSSMAGVFDIPNKIILMMAQVVAVIVQSLKPAASKLQEERRSDQLQELFYLGSKYSVMVSTPMLVFFLVYGDTVLQLWMRSGYLPEMATILTIMVIPMTLRIWSDASFYIVAGMGRHRVFGAISLVTAGLSVLVSCGLVWLGGLGVEGIAVGFAVSMGMVSGVVLPWYCCRVMQVSFWSWVRRSVAVGMWASLPFALATMGARVFGWVPAGRGTLLMMMGLLGVIGVAGWWILGFSELERKRFGGYLPKWLKRRELQSGRDSGTNDGDESNRDGGIG